MCDAFHLSKTGSYVSGIKRITMTRSIAARIATIHSHHAWPAFMIYPPMTGPEDGRGRAAD